MCNTWKYPSKVKEEFKPEHLKSLPEMKFTNITGGEPLLREDIQEIISIIKSKTKRIVVSTNGYFTERIVELAKKNSDIGFRISIEGLPKANDELRGVKDGFDHGLRSLLELHKLGIEDIGFGITVSDKNYKDLLELYELAKAMNLEFATAVTHNSYYFHKYDNVFNHKEDINSEFMKLVLDFLKSSKLKNWYRAYFNYGLINYVNGGKRFLPCEAGTNLFFLDPFGELRPCNGMEETMGNIKNNNFEEIWNSKKAQEVRQKVKSCNKNCWMIGSVSPAMKKYIWIPTKWIIKNKIRLFLGKEICI